MQPVHTIDLHYLGRPNVIGTYAIPHKQGVALIESGPGSTIANLEEGLKALGYSLNSVTDVFLSHIHLDHAGASGLLARAGARIHVHPEGARHMAEPERLLASAGRIYGDQMEVLWGKLLPVPEEKLNILSDNERVDINEISIIALDTPGHAQHHLAFIFEDVCFAGDIGGIRFPGVKTLRLPTPPPEFHLEKWRSSAGRLKETGCKRIVPTHFGIYPDCGRQLDEVKRQLDEIEAGLSSFMTGETSPEEVNDWMVNWLSEREKGLGQGAGHAADYETLSPTASSAAGVHRYWHKYRL